MKKIVFSMAVLAFVFAACEKSNIPVIKSNDIIIGGLYRSYTEVVQEKYNTQFTIGENTFNSNILEAQLYTHQPSSDQNVFHISLIDSNQMQMNSIRFEIYTALMKPEAFFRKGICSIDRVVIIHNHQNDSFSDDMDGKLFIFTWDTASCAGMHFKGRGSLELIKKAEGPFLSGDYFPAQKFTFEFR